MKRLRHSLLLLWLVAAQGWPPSAAHANTLCVNHGGTGGCLGTIADAVNSAADGDTIRIAGGAPYLEHLVLTKSLSLIGETAATTILDGSAAGQVIRITTPITVTLANLTIRNGLAQSGDSGGGIHNELGTLTLNNVVVTGNHTGGGVHIGGYGGGIGNVQGRVTLNHSVVSDNSTGSGTGLNGSGANGGVGGGIYNNFGELTLVDSQVSGNSTGSGGNDTNVGGTGGDGAGLYGEGDHLIILNSAFRDNTTGSGGTGAFGGNGGSGGGIYFLAGYLTMVDSTVSGNQTGQGGIFNGKSGSGAGLYLVGALAGPRQFTMTSSTISGNATGLGTAGPDGGDGGGLFLRAAITLTLLNDTLAYNDVDEGQIGGAIANGLGSVVSLRNTLLAHNTAGANPDSVHDCSGTLTSADYNLITVPECSITQLSDDQFWLGGQIVLPLADNGGPTQTNALPPGSPAIDAGDNAACPATDLRGFPRPAFGGTALRCDVGAYELYRFAVSLPALWR